MNQQFQVSVEKEMLIFSAAHFITFGDDVCESLHGHNYRVACRVTGELDRHACVIDFIWLRDRLHQITSQLDHKTLLPEHHARIRVQREEQNVVARFEDRYWSFPAQDVVILPVENTTAERIAQYIATQLAPQLQGLEGVAVKQFAIGVDENEGQWGWCVSEL